MKLILASGSPRRAELLEKMGLTFQVEPSNTDEILEPGLTPEQEVVHLSLGKAKAVAANHPEEAVVLSADTVVELDGEILGKPHSREEAVSMLRRLSGREHRVHTAVRILSPAGSRSLVSTAEVHFAPMTDREIEWYVSTGEPMDKAGAYGIQGYACRYITGIRGDYYTVMGLPVQMLYRALCDLGILGEN